MTEKLHSTTQRLVDTLQSACQRSLNFVEESDMIETYKNTFKGFGPIDANPRPLAGSSTEAKKLRKLIQDDVLMAVNELIDEFIKEEGLDIKFKSLDKAISSTNPSSTKSWRPPGNAEQHIVPFMVAVKTEQKAELKKLVAAEREKLNILKNRLNVKRDRVRSLEMSIREKKEKIEEQLGAKLRIDVD